MAKLMTPVLRIPVVWIIISRTASRSNASGALCAVSQRRVRSVKNPHSHNFSVRMRVLVDQG